MLDCRHFALNLINLRTVKDEKKYLSKVHGFFCKL